MEATGEGRKATDVTDSAEVAAEEREEPLSVTALPDAVSSFLCLKCVRQEDAYVPPSPVSTRGLSLCELLVSGSRTFAQPVSMSWSCECAGMAPSGLDHVLPCTSWTPSAAVRDQG